MSGSKFSINLVTILANRLSGGHDKTIHRSLVHLHRQFLLLTPITYHLRQMAYLNLTSSKLRNYPNCQWRILDTVSAVFSVVAILFFIVLFPHCCLQLQQPKPSCAPPPPISNITIISLS